MSDPRFVWLRSGAVIPLAAFTLALDLERRGVRLTLDGDDLLVEGRDLTDVDLAELRRWKIHVRALIAHVADDAHLRDSPRAARARRTA